jgi:hypothetical protein
MVLNSGKKVRVRCMKVTETEARNCHEYHKLKMHPSGLKGGVPILISADDVKIRIKSWEASDNSSGLLQAVIISSTGRRS